MKIHQYYVLKKPGSYFLTSFDTEAEALAWVAANIRWHPEALVKGMPKSNGSDSAW